MEIVEAALSYTKQKSGTKSDTVAFELIVQQFMGTGLAFSNAKSALTAEFKKAGDETIFLEKLANWLEEIVGREVTISVSG
jgi:hypothetical protein